MSRVMNRTNCVRDRIQKNAASTNGTTKKLR